MSYSLLHLQFSSLLDREKAWVDGWMERKLGKYEVWFEKFLYNIGVSVTQSCLTLHDLVDCSPLGSSVHEIFQARI